MKKKLLLHLALFCFITPAFTQPYFFTQSTTPYSSLSGATSINGTTVWSSFQSFAVPIGFTFNFMGTNYSTIYIEGSGFTRFDANYYYLINPFTVQLKDKGTSTSLSPLSYKLEGSSPNRILKIEWNNCGFVYDASGTANFQLWLYETSNIIETHIGSCAATAGAYNGNTNPGPAMGIYRFSSGTFCVYGIGLLGNPASANDSIIQNANADIFDFSLNSTPQSGHVYRFTPGSMSVGEDMKGEDWIVFPNPVLDVLNIVNAGPENRNTDYCISDLSGRKILGGTMNANCKIDLYGLAAGIYVFKVAAEGREICCRRIVKF